MMLYCITNFMFKYLSQTYLSLFYNLINYFFGQTLNFNPKGKCKGFCPSKKCTINVDIEVGRKRSCEPHIFPCCIAHGQILMS